MSNEIVKLRAYDALYQGKLNPRCTFHCDVCGKFYSCKMENVPIDGSPSFTLILNDDDTESDCVHYNDVQITEDIYRAHMDDLMEHGLLEELE